MLKGAEAELLPVTFFNANCLVKRRLAKNYRIPALDLRLRSERTKREGRLLHKAKLNGVRCPLVLHVDTAKCELFISIVNGKLLARCTQPTAFEQAGEQLALLHATGIAHGDSTTSNFILDTKGKVWVIDFGLSQLNPSLEEQAIDLLLFQKSVSPGKFKRFAKGYRSVNSSILDLLLAKVEEIKLRARYAER